MTVGIKDISSDVRFLRGAPLPLGFIWGTGKAALMGSLNQYFTNMIPDESFDFDNPIIPVTLPGYGVVEKGLFSKGAYGFEDYLGVRNGRPLYGKKNQTLVEFSAWDDESIHPGAVGKVRQMRDKIVYVLYNAGKVEDEGGVGLPPILLYDYSQNPPVQMGFIQLDPADNSINEKFLVDPVSSNIKIYKLLVRLFWWEYTRN